MPRGVIQQNDPAELLEVFDAEGNPTGRAKSRARIHLDGDWHQAFHCWITRRGAHGEPEVVLQRRSRLKDTFPGCWDAAAAGHWRFGETARQAAREVQEELGLQVPFERLVYAFTWPVSREHPNGLRDREHHRVYRLELDAPLASYRPDVREVSGVGAFRARDLLRLVAGEVAAIRATEAVVVAPDGTVRVAHGVRATREALVPLSVERVARVLGWWHPERGLEVPSLGS